MAKLLLKSCSLNTARFLKYVWTFYSIMHERVKDIHKNHYFAENKSSSSLVIPCEFSQITQK